MRQQQRMVAPAYDWEPRRQQARQPARAPRRRRPRRRLRRPALLLLLFCAASALAGMQTGRARSAPAPTPVAAPAPRPAAQPAAPVNPFGRANVNILVVGTDAGDLQPGSATGRTDTMLLLSADLEQQALAVLSIPRDTLVELPGHGSRKINAAWSLGGVALAAQAVANVTQQEVDHFVRLDLAGFEQVVDALGGVNLAVEKRMYYIDRSQDLRIDLQPGQQRLSGEQAMQYIRYRSDAEGDLGRIRRQQHFLRALLATATARDRWARLPAVIGSLGKQLETTLSPVQVARLLQLLARLDAAKLAAAQLPGQARLIDGTSYFIPAANAGLVAADLKSAALPATSLAPLVTIYNGSDRLGLEKVVVAELAGRGYRAVAAPRSVVAQTAQTRVYGASARHLTAARRVALALGVTASSNAAPPAFPPAATAPGAAPVVLVLGADFPR